MKQVIIEFTEQVLDDLENICLINSLLDSLNSFFKCCARKWCKITLVKIVKKYKNEECRVNVLRKINRKTGTWI